MKTGTLPAAWLAAALALTTLSSCKKPVAETAEEEEAPAATPTARVVVATPRPAPIAAAISTPLPDPLAPPGVFFLLQKASITTDEGIVGLKPGQVLRETGPGAYQVGAHTIQLRADQVTNNLRVARQFAVADAASQAALRQALQATPVPMAATPANRNATSAASTAPHPRAVASAGNSLSGGPALGAGTGAADPERSNRRNVKVDNSGRQYWRDSRGSIRYDF